MPRPGTPTQLQAADLALAQHPHVLFLFLDRVLVLQFFPPYTPYALFCAQTFSTFSIRNVLFLQCCRLRPFTSLLCRSLYEISIFTTSRRLRGLERVVCACDVGVLTWPITTCSSALHLILNMAARSLSHSLYGYVEGVLLFVMSTPGTIKVYINFACMGRSIDL
jgi:hypothetical protein